jgi:hypothetical protein
MYSHPLREIPPYNEHPDTLPYILRNLQLIEGAVSAVQKLLNSNK